MNKENEEREVHDNTVEEIEHDPKVRGEVSGVAVVEAEVEDGETGDHLGDLEEGDDDGDDVGDADGATEGAGHEEVVEVHDRVDEEVHEGEGAALGDEEDPGVPAVDHGDDVVVPVEEDDFLFLEDQPQGVEELRHFGDAEQEGERGEALARGGADVVGEARFQDGHDEVAALHDGAQQREHGQRQIPPGQDVLQHFGWRAVLHVLLQKDDDEEIVEKRKQERDLVMDRHPSTGVCVPPLAAAQMTRFIPRMGELGFVGVGRSSIGIRLRLAVTSECQIADSRQDVRCTQRSDNR